MISAWRPAVSAIDGAPRFEHHPQRAGVPMLRGLPRTDFTAPDILVVSVEWPERALLRAQLIENGYEVAGIDSFPIPGIYRRAGMRPRVLVIDLRSLPSPRQALDDARLVLPSDHIVVLTALGTLSADELRREGFVVVERPVTIGQIAAAVAGLMSPAEQRGRPRSGADR